MGLCVGAELKATLAVVRGRQVIVSQHLGDLKHALTWERFQETADDLMQLYDIRPDWIAADRHPLYLSTDFARRLAERCDARLYQVQHHHAHAAAVAAEHQCVEPVLALVADGAGYGDRGEAWGGELLLADLCGYRRVGRLQPMPLIGGDQAAKDIRRCGLALLKAAFPCCWRRHEAALRLLPDAEQRQWLTLALERGVRSPGSSSLGRLFDGVASLLGVSQWNQYEAQAAQRLESLAWRYLAEHDWPTWPASLGGSLSLTAPSGPSSPSETEQALFVWDPAALVRVLLDLRQAGAATHYLACLFHVSLAEALHRLVLQAADAYGIGRVSLSGGVFCNEMLTELLTQRCRRAGLQVLAPREIPPNDGGIAFGQAAVAVVRWEEEQA